MKLTLHHINVTGHDVPGLDAFYSDVLCQQPIPEMAEIPTLDANALRVPVAFRTDGQVQFHLAQQDLGLAMRQDKFIRHLEAQGVAYVDYGTTFTQFWHQIFFLDPAGTIIEVHQVLDDSKA